MNELIAKKAELKKKKYVSGNNDDGDGADDEILNLRKSEQKKEGSAKKSKLREMNITQAQHVERK